MGEGEAAGSPVSEGDGKLRRKRGLVRLELLLAATDALLNEHELEDISLRDIAQKAGVPISSVYHFFPNREAAFSTLSQRHFENFETLSDAGQPEAAPSWQAYIGQRIEASAAYCNANPSVMRLLLGPYTTRDSRRSGVKGVELVAARRIASLQELFEMPRIEGLLEKMVAAIALVDGIHSLSYARDGQVTAEATQESIRAALAYLRCYLPEYIAPLAPDSPAA
jgi:AcrR family transcriptional regulator